MNLLTAPHGPQAKESARLLTRQHWMTRLEQMTWRHRMTTQSLMPRHHPEGGTGSLHVVDQRRVKTSRVRMN